MTLSQTAITHLVARLQVIEAITNLILQELPAMLGENVIEGLAVADRRLLRERMALYKSIIVGLRDSGSTESTADELTRTDIARVYLDAQDTMVHIGQAVRKLRALSAGTIEDAPVTAEQTDIWNVKLDESLAALDARIAGFPDKSL